MLRFLSLFIFFIFFAMRSQAQAPQSPHDELTHDAQTESATTGARAALGTFHFQFTTVSQQHGQFGSPYQGMNSLNGAEDSQTSITSTIFAGHRLWPGAEAYINPELAGGSGFNQTRGVAGFPNGEIYRVDDPSPKWNLARAFVKHVFGFGGEQEKIEDDKNQIAATVDEKRLTVVLGKFALNDYFDNNSYSHDPRTQFLNWALMDNAAWDYAADTRGYSWGFVVELNQPSWAVRFASVLVPMSANQMSLEKRLPAYRGDNLEFDYHYKVGERKAIIRTLAYENHADMGNYRQALNAASPGVAPDVTATRALSIKYGFGINFEQELSPTLGVFGRASWNDGATETWAFTEVDQAISAGLSMKGMNWNRTDDVAGVALIINGLSNDHRDYLSAGGYGFIIGDGKLRYAPETIGEIYYLVQVLKGLSATADFQFISNPGYNQDRGPVPIATFRLHCEL